MLGETEENWQRCVEKTLELAPDSVTIYQMELPFNTTISRDILAGTGQFKEHVANWATKRRWVQEAFAALEQAGYHVGSAYTAVKDPSRTRFLYRDRLWQGADLVGLGVASFGHVNGVHMQNLDTWEAYGEAIRTGELPLARAYRPSARRAADPRAGAPAQAGVGSGPAYFKDKYGVDVRDAVRAARSPRWPPTATWPRRTTTWSPSPARALLRVDVAAPALLPARARRASATRESESRGRPFALSQEPCPSPNTTRSWSAAGPGAPPRPPCWPSTATGCCSSSGSPSRATTSASRSSPTRGSPSTGSASWTGCKQVGLPEEVQRAVRLHHGPGLPAVLLLPDHQARVLDDLAGVARRVRRHAPGQRAQEGSGGPPGRGRARSDHGRRPRGGRARRTPGGGRPRRSTPRRWWTPRAATRC